MPRSQSRQRKDKKSRKQKHHKRDRQDRQYKKYEHQYSSKSPERSKSNERRRSKSKDRKKDKDKERKRYEQHQKDNRYKKDRSRSPQKNIIGKQGKKYSRERSREKKNDVNEDDQIMLRQKRLAMVRLLCQGGQAMNLLNQMTSNKMKQEPAKEPKIQTPTPPVETPKIQTKQTKRKSRWQKSGAASTIQNVPLKPQIVHIPIQITPSPAMVVEEEKGKEPNLSLDVFEASQDRDLLKVSQSVDIEQEQKVGYRDDNLEDDPLQTYMKQIQGAAVPQLQLTQAGKQNCISYEDIVTINTTNKKMIDEDEVQDEKFKKQFMAAIQKIDPTEASQQMSLQKKQNQNDDQIIDTVDAENEDDNHAQDDDDKFLDKQKKLAERKEFNQIDHSKIKYEQVRFNLYRESEQIKMLTKEEVDKYRKEAGDIKVRGKDIPNPVFNWYQCGLSDKVLQVIQQRQYKKPFPIQAQSFPLMMSGRDVIGIAETGSGKTMAYMIPVIKHIQNQRRVEQGQGPIALIMIPTRELARQVYAEFKAFCKPMGIRCLAVYGGLGVQTQLSDLKKGAQIIICTPGRMIDVLTLSNGKITNLRRVTMIVVDEADRMFDLGFQPQITKVLNNIRPMRQTVMFSATFPKNVQSLAKRILKKPVQIIVGSRGQACSNITQIIQVREQTSKFWRLLQILGYWNDKGSILIFVDKKSEVDFLFKELLAYGYHSLPLHSGMDPTDRQFTIYDFKKGVLNILVATSICSRGLDIKNIVLVVNFKCPNHLQDYIHRIGRTGRAGNKGTAITFITPQEEMYSLDMLKALEMADIEPPEQLKKLSETYLSKVKKGEAKKIRNRNMTGIGYKFNEEQEDNDQSYKDIIKKQLKAEGLGAFDDSDDEDIQKQKKRDEEKRGRNNQQKAVEALKDPQLKQKLLIETAKALSQAINAGIPMTTQKIIKLAVDKMKQEATKHTVIRTVEDGQRAVQDLIDKFQKNNPNGPTFSFDHQINDFPLNARSRVTSPKFLNQLKELTTCNVTVRGQYFEAGKKIPVGARKLYLHIQGQNKSYVSSAYKQIKRTLQEQSMQNYQGQLALKYGM